MSGARIASLLTRTYAIYRGHLRLMLAVTGGVVAVVDLILGLGLGQLTSAYRSTSAPSELVITFAASAFVSTPLITAMLARAVLEVVAGEQPSVRRAVRSGLDVFAPLLIAVVLWIAAVIAGFLAFVVPGLFVLVSWYFVAQAVVVDNRRGLAALARSGEMVRGRWLEVALTGVTFQLVTLIPGSIAAVLFDALARTLNASAVLVFGDIVVQSFALSFVAVGATLFYLDLCVERHPGDAGA